MLVVSLATLLPLAVLILAFAAAFRFGRRPAVTEPSCGRCGYNVTGLTRPFCPECGSDLTFVGVRRPGDVRPLDHRVKRALALLVLLVPTVAVVYLTDAFIAPTAITTTQQRVIFSFVPAVNVTVAAELVGSRESYGRRSVRPIGPAAMDRLILRRQDDAADAAVPEARLPLVEGRAIEMSAVAEWLTAIGHRGPRVDDVAAFIARSADEMRSGQAATFAEALPDPDRAGMNSLIAHPAAPAWSRTQATPIGQIVPLAAGGAFYLLGTIAIIRKTRPPF